MAHSTLGHRCSIVGVVASPDDLSSEDVELADILEIRLDLLSMPLKEVFDAVSTFQKPLIATCRASMEGGGFSGTERERERLLCEAMEHVDMVDVELAAHEIREGVVRCARELGLKVILSHHDFLGTPSLSRMLEVFTSELESGADIAKVAVMPNDMGDTLVLLEAVYAMRGASGDVCGISMGELGKPTRLLAPLYGSALTYGSLNSTVAPGQLSVGTLRRGMDMLGALRG
ncbi:type I 3-dehydroquinate dehydratase [Methermicoccus shengliensis]|uniref:3-dehydroquinate dehydratase n=1 Tax=Methermicoccus shengliensis TaxID=660064 RepID=A0A832RVN8_9EURY|nr:type I 3-dehydroquinate dehydratase [Methermicoccus shengliensis]KUK04640.1 MAG: 3-dehydroquinate dehydratase [Euryarchaeota archaeon 55_53]KUK30767.1 MAG: 3-dehydroquinate dehydratase [Methanosarcinales archeaon 56_1174]MDI3487966.1 3-dehydroquinate dehydratase [Methanosarcinales archaeon]MDN5295104.1 3-dehydroquinate dehydratase [Methanosarcinales archaeon]HIH69128.1 type I 3-dehydroquinate dehydratase [Methermicoccus shengliensis]